MKIKNAVCYSFSLNDESPLAYLRLIAPLRQSGINIVNGIENNQININRISEGDVVIIQREFPKEFDSYEKIIEIARKEGKPVIFDLDDLLLYLPENHPDRQSAYYSSSLLPMFQALMEADLVSVSTPKLRDFVINYNDNVAVLPNYFDDNLWQLKPPALKTSENETLTIGYMGGNSHKPDLEYITPVVLDLINCYPQKIRFQFWGVQPPVEVASLTQVQWSIAPTYRYKDFAAFFQAQTADILIAPLIDNLFNRCKSPIKFFEYSALGVPGVFSRLETYTDVITHGHNGLLASSLDEWTNCLIQLIEDKELRFYLAKNAQEIIRSNWLLSRNAFRWKETLQSAFVNSSSDRGQKDKILKIIRSTNHQLTESSLLKEAEVQTLTAQVAEKEQSVQALTAQVAEKEQSVQALTAQVAEKEQSVQALSTQIAEINSSKAWKIALLFRRIRVLLAPPNSRRAWVLRRLINVIFVPFKTISRNQEFKKVLALIRLSGLFDETWYLTNNPDVADAKIDPVRHYLLFGGFEKRDPSPRFCSGWYLDTYEDVKKAGINPLVHFLKYGISEGRKAQSAQAMQSLLPLVVEEEQVVQALPQRPTPTGWTHPSNGSRIERLFIGFKNCIFFMSVGVFNKSKRAKITYILKNYGLISLAKAITKKLKATFLGGENNNPQSITNLITSPVDTLDSVNISKWAEFNTKTKLRMFLKSDAVLELPVSAQPVVSIILLFHNRAELSLQCLETVAAGASNIPFEVVIVDNASTDETPALLDRIRNAKIVRNSTNSGFGGGCNQAVDLAVGKYLLFLNNDTELLSNSIKVMLDTLENGTNIGAVGGKLVFPDGRLQEAGSIIWRDGSCAGYGRNDDPFKPEFSYVKDVDYCSGALLLTPRDLFLSLGKFDSRYAPAYYEDTDYCLQLWSNGYRVVFQPFAVAVHYEFGSSGTTNAIALQIKNQEKFTKKWQDVLAGFDFPEPGNIIFSREHKTDSKRILFIDDQIPDYRLGSGYPRSYHILQMLAEMGYRLTFLPMQIPDMVPEITQSLQLKGVEVLYSGTGQKIDFEAFLKSRPDYYNIAFVSRPHNMQDAIKHLINHAKQTTVVYDAEAIFSLRDIKFNELNGEHMTEAEEERLIRTEVTLIKDANIVTTVSEMEKEIFVKYGALSVHVLGHIVEPKPTPATFEERMDILFVGGILRSPSPNEDAVHFFANRILPLVRRKVKCEFYIVGTNKVKAIWDLASDYIHVVGKVDDLTSYYNHCRLFVVPTRYSAGIPFKMHEAAAYGLPAVITPLTANQLGWQENRDILVGHDPKDFARKVIELYLNRDIFYSLRQNALDRIREECSPEYFRKNLEHILTLAMDRKNGQKTA